MSVTPRQPSLSELEWITRATRAEAKLAEIEKLHQPDEAHNPWCTAGCMPVIGGHDVPITWPCATISIINQ
jgi:hypothetical protein